MRRVSGAGARDPHGRRSLRWSPGTLDERVPDAADGASQIDPDGDADHSDAFLAF